MDSWRYLGRAPLGDFEFFLGEVIVVALRVVAVLAMSI